jgi:ribosome-associated protein
MPEVVIRTESIRLSQFLKLANIAQDGVEAKFLVLDGMVKVNGALETRRGRKLKVGDRVEFQENTFHITSADQS